MSDFASAAVLRLIQCGLRRQGIAVPVLKRPRGAHVPLADKRALVDQLLRDHGAHVLLRMGEAVRDLQDEPALVALSVAREPLDLIARWQRLERFVHSRHRVLVDQSGDGGVLLRHASLDAGQPPTAAEDMLVFGLLVALIDWLGTEGLQARLVGDPRSRYRQGQWMEQPLPKDVSTWALTWSPAGPRPAARPAADHDCVEAAHRLLAADPGRRWTLQTLAGDMSTSPRSLQRRLAAGQSSFSARLLEVRLAQAAKLLANSRQPPAEIGYVCGFSDQAHFTREFKRHTALTPGKFREQFAACAAGPTLASGRGVAASRRADSRD